jgi:hypothetical protein
MYNIDDICAKYVQFAQLSKGEKNETLYNVRNPGNGINGFGSLWVRLYRGPNCRSHNGSHDDAGTDRNA